MVAVVARHSVKLYGDKARAGEADEDAETVEDAKDSAACQACGVSLHRQHTLWVGTVHLM